MDFLWETKKEKEPMKGKEEVWIQKGPAFLWGLCPSYGTFLSWLLFSWSASQATFQFMKCREMQRIKEKIWNELERKVETYPFYALGIFIFLELQFMTHISKGKVVHENWYWSFNMHYSLCFSLRILSILEMYGDSYQSCPYVNRVSMDNAIIKIEIYFIQSLFLLSFDNALVF